MIDRASSRSSSSPADSFNHQDGQFATAFSILQKAIANRAFPGASIAVTHAGKLVALKAIGHFTYERHGDNESGSATDASSSSLGAPFLAAFARSGDSTTENLAVHPSTLFDLASLTKVLATTPMAMLLYERGILDLDTPVAEIVAEFLADSAKDPHRRKVTLRMLLAHSSGLPAYEKLFQKAKTRDELLHAALTTPLAADPGSRAVYSDIGFIILGIALERLASEPLDRFCQREIFGPLAMTSTTFSPPAEFRAQIPPTADERPCGAGALARELPKSQPQSSASQQNPSSTFRRRVIQGEVQDENAYVLGAVAPHAGLFSTALDLAKYAHCMLDCGAGMCGAGALARENPYLKSKDDQHRRKLARPLFRPETIALFTSRNSSPQGTTRTLGWDTPSNPSQSGKYFLAQSFGHLGYTGTSLWIDPQRQLSITVLTNRTWPDCTNQAIKQVRPKFHDAVGESIKT